MANGEILKGEVYWINTSDAIGGEEMTGRPGVIVSSDYGNEKYPTVTIAYTTTQQRNGVVYPYIYASGHKTWVLCNQIRTIDKSRLQKYIGVCSEYEMVQIERGIRTALDFKYQDLEDEIEEYRNLAEQRNVENEMLRRQYEMVLNQLVEMKVAADVQERVKLGESEAVEPPHEEAPEWVLPNRIVKSVLDAAPASAFAGKVNTPSTKNKKAKVREESPKKEEPVVVNVNTATIMQLTDLGFTPQTAAHILHNRRMKGPFRSVDDLKNVDTMDTKLLKKIRDKLEV